MVLNYSLQFKVMGFWLFMSHDKYDTSPLVNSWVIWDLQCSFGFVENNAADKNIVYGCDDDPNMPNLEEIVYSDDDEGVNAKADMTNLDTHILVSPTPTTRIHKDHPLKQIIRDIHSAP
ncbi:hypothetical protein Tco_0003546 [Tanacetum coccineum]